MESSDHWAKELPTGNAAAAGEKEGTCFSSTMQSLLEYQVSMKL